MSSRRNQLLLLALSLGAQDSEGFTRHDYVTAHSRSM